MKELPTEEQKELADSSRERLIQMKKSRKGLTGGSVSPETRPNDNLEKPQKLNRYHLEMGPVSNNICLATAAAATQLCRTVHHFQARFGAKCLLIPSRPVPA